MNDNLRDEISELRGVIEDFDKRLKIIESLVVSNQKLTWNLETNIDEIQSRFNKLLNTFNQFGDVYKSFKKLEFHISEFKFKNIKG